MLGDYSTTYDAIPQVAAEKFANLIKPELEKLGVPIEGILALPTKGADYEHLFWKNKT